MKLSKYVRTIKYNDEVILYNTVDHAMVQLPKEAVKGNELEDILDDDSLSALREMGYLVETDTLVENQMESYLINRTKLFISVELNLSCNLRCPYCYQAGTHNGKCVDDRVLEKIVDYANAVYQKDPFSDLFLKILGGEPTLVWQKFEKIYGDLLRFCNEKGVKMHLLFDTNGTMINDLLTLSGYASLLFTIPLTAKECHDDVRKDVKGNGTYDLIIENINIIKREKPEAKIVIRYNVDNENVKLFDIFLEDIERKLTFKPLISVNYTAELNKKKDFGNRMTYREFVEWSSSEAIDSLIKNKMPVTISPIVSVEECQFRSKYGLKVFSDGTVGSCAMDFFENGRMSIDELLFEIDEDNPFSLKKKNQTIMVDEQCLKCDSIFLCGGTNKLPCIKALDYDLCKDKHFGIDIDMFIKKYMECQENNTSDLFVVFENGESYR